jgi:hypothetical protein
VLGWHDELHGVYPGEAQAIGVRDNMGDSSRVKSSKFPVLNHPCLVDEGNINLIHTKIPLNRHC